MPSSPTNPPAEYAVAFQENLPLIDRIVTAIIRRHSLNHADADEFRIWVHERIFENDYAILRHFGGKSSLPTYLTVVLSNLFRDFRNSRWGRWRPSAEAQRRGPVAIRIETLVWRDGHSVREAVEILQHSGCKLSDSELVKLAAQLPARHLEKEVALDDVRIGAPLSTAADASVSSDADTRMMERALLDAIEDLSPEDAVMVRLRYWSGLSVADVAKTLKAEQKPLYKRFDAIKARLRSGLVARGFDQHRVLELVTGEEYR